MLIDFTEYLTYQNIYLFANFGILPFWLLIITIPNSRITLILVNSIILPLILSSLYVYIIYQAILLDENLFDIFLIYLNIDNLYTIFATENFLLAFWIHFVTLNLFLGCWVARDAFKYGITRKFAVLPLVLIYLSGPIGLVIYWLIRIFVAKKLGIHD